ncbi:hypothetical protein BT96DRAFT_929278 [Gymnopus androsaceus JB14]|uniref:Uncharacterized protein n=1 Tax=Gymnopus androsaceus JB14 TaxID=1447944 RepID=A0A6A4GG36_9AGAR|nr:hypothetical protein BT96DRAFT_929278 [Gymnopus androsaceus JB14]
MKNGNETLPGIIRCDKEPLDCAIDGNVEYCWSGHEHDHRSVCQYSEETFRKWICAGDANLECWGEYFEDCWGIRSGQSLTGVASLSSKGDSPGDQDLVDPEFPDLEEISFCDS